jgi:hypothetical protein
MDGKASISWNEDSKTATLNRQKNNISTITRYINLRHHQRDQVGSRQWRVYEDHTG